ncbi:MAG: 16S rRNA (uracil(1498)-N(3))-methyltransferase [Desulfobulbaceae bacterium]|nr:16S rRNA (uracil(1498)-N(3))-methyltransferase [Desulfobulbaceae bacterium]HIJ79089.1 16S rRNA (uracil(1498)-N(3))-methyltransferase [Deltaproteobacteria bacterium]
MNLILLAPDEINQQSVVLTDRRAKHISTVLRNAAGDTVRVGIINGAIGQGVIKEIDRHRVVLEISLGETPAPMPPTDLILAVPRPIMLKRVLAQAASMGVERIFLIKAKRVEKSFFSSAIIQDEAFLEPLLLGLEQAIATRVPKISLHHRFLPFVDDELPAMLADCPTRLLAHPDTAKTIAASCALPLNGRAVLAIGPEGGWVDFEVEKFKSQGFVTFSMGPRILRVDTAVPALLAQLSLLREMTG